MRMNEELIKIGYRMTRTAWLKDPEDTGEVWATYIYPDAISIAPYAMFNSQDLAGFFIKGSRKDKAQVWTPTPEDRAANDWKLVGTQQVEDMHKHLLHPKVQALEVEEDGFVFEMPEEVQALVRGVQLAQKACFQANVRSGWWTNLKTGEDLRDTDGTGIKRNTGELLMLAVTEIAEAMEGARKNLMDDHLPHRKMEEVELADAIYRIFDIAESKGYDIASALVEKAAYNLQRADHKLENRLKDNGKKV